VCMGMVCSLLGVGGGCWGIKKLNSSQMHVHLYGERVLMTDYVPDRCDET